MKKFILSLTIILGLGLCCNAQHLYDTDANSLFGYAFDQENSSNEGATPLLPIHGENTNQSATPLAGGTLLLAGLGAAYALSKRKK